MPPESPSYQLRRLWLDPQEFARYYGGFANEGLWPLCHVVDVRPKFRAEDWEAYQAVNAQFAEAIDAELAADRQPGLHPGLPPGPGRAARCASGGLTRAPRSSGTFPGRIPDRLRICPWRRELLAGLLANDLLAFQLERDRRNFLAAVEDELGAEIEDDGVRVRFDERTTTVVSVPIGVDYDRIQTVGGDEALVDRAGAAEDALQPRRPHRRAWASIGSTTRRAFPSGWTRSIGCSRAVPTCAGS